MPLTRAATCGEPGSPNTDGTVSAGSLWKVPPPSVEMKIPTLRTETQSVPPAAQSRAVTWNVAPTPGSRSVVWRGKVAPPSVDTDRPWPVVATATRSGSLGEVAMPLIARLFGK